MVLSQLMWTSCIGCDARQLESSGWLSAFVNLTNLFCCLDRATTRASSSAKRRWRRRRSCCAATRRMPSRRYPILALFQAHEIGGAPALLSSLTLRSTAVQFLALCARQACQRTRGPEHACLCFDVVTVLVPIESLVVSRLRSLQRQWST